MQAFSTDLDIESEVNIKLFLMIDLLKLIKTRKALKNKHGIVRPIRFLALVKPRDIKLDERGNEIDDILSYFYIQLVDVGLLPMDLFH